MDTEERELHVLVILNSPLLGKIFAICLGREGITTSVYTNPIIPMALLRDSRLPQPDAAFIDVGLRNIDGFEVIERLKRAYDRTAIIAIASDEGLVIPRLKARIAGARACIYKPVKIQHIIGCVRTFTSARADHSEK